jgi:uncharacterized membrane protein
VSKTIIAPIVGFLLLAVKVIFGIEFPVEIGGQITDAIVVVASLVSVIYGIVKNHQVPPQGPNDNHIPQ